MGLENVAALAGLIAVIAPVLVQIRARKASAVAPFPSVELVRSLERHTRRERIVAGAPLLVARTGVIACAALALAAPYVGDLPPARGALASGGVAVLLDASSSWQGERGFEDARAAARSALEFVESRGGDATLLAFDDLPARPQTGARAVEAVERAVPTGRAAHLATALAAAMRLHGADPHGAAPARARRDPAAVVVITSPTAAAEARRQAAATGMRAAVFAPAGTGRRPEVCIAEAAAGADRVRVLLEAARPPARAEVTVYLDDGAVPCVRHEVVCSAARTELDLLMPPRRRTASLLRVEAATDPPAPAHVRWLRAPRMGPPRIVNLVAGGRAGPSADVLGRALAALQAAGSDAGPGPALEATTAASSAMDAEALGEFDVVCIVDAHRLPPAAWNAVEEYLSCGGRVLVGGEEPLDAHAYRLCGLRAGDPARAGPGRLAACEGAFALSSGASFGGRAVVDAVDARVLVTFEDGAPAVTIHRVGRGAIALAACEFGELGARPSVALPFVNALVGTLVDRPVPPLVRGAAEAPCMVPLPAAVSCATAVAVPPSGARIVLPVIAPVGEGARWMRVPCAAPGLWRVILAPDEQTRGGPLEILVGVNAEPARVDGAGVPGEPGVEGVPLVHSQAGLCAFLAGRGALPLAPACALLCLVCLGAELAIARRSWRQPDEP